MKCINSNRPQVIGASQPIVAPLGGDVILPCHVEPQLNVEELTVEWWRPDVPPDPRDPQSNYRYVHRYHDKHHEENMKKPAYAGRTEMFTDGLKHGNISLKISNVEQSDQGRYRCQIPQLGRASVIMFNVEPRSVETWTTKTPLHPHNLQSRGPNNETDVKGGPLYLSVLIPVLAILLILAVGVGGCLLYRRYRNQNTTSRPHQSESGGNLLAVRTQVVVEVCDGCNCSFKTTKAGGNRLMVRPITCQVP
ncbi:myelin-oligodendrocyte glycoprotein-like isoform X2 [Perca fluviatilis]|uniref:myelin-oligodendrocyte glycoprotein-like isoform X2 n=1 Tax=Perca fluviatilis TaxID=8168 RepID=UPI001964AF55|nr:myelin-oligodendrocyte glycoprotein-like isoform X2 [Perca fluviatilis]